MNKFEFKNLTPFKWFVLQNFPFIEADFDAITNWQLFCKLGEKINELIKSMNLTGEQVETLTDFVNNYFNNLDVQEEINNKLDEMVKDGTLAQIINNELLAEINQQVSKNTTDINSIIEEQTRIKNNATIMVGDSYGVGITAGATITGWCDILKNLMNLSDANYYKFVEGGAGFVKESPAGNNFLKLLQNNINRITDKNSICNIIVCGGYNDNSASDITCNQYIKAFINYAKQQFPNAKVYVGMIGYSGRLDSDGATIRNNLNNYILRSYQNCINYGGLYLSGVECIMHDMEFMSTDNIHPVQIGYDYLARYIFQAYKQGFADYVNGLKRNDLITNDGVSSNKTPIYDYMNNYVHSMVMNSVLELRFATPFTLSRTVDLGVLTFNYYRPTKAIIKIPIQYFVMKSNNNTFYGGTGFLILREDGHLILQTDILDNSGSSFLFPENIIYIAIRPFSYSSNLFM